jgi:hypothetical protein
MLGRDYPRDWLAIDHSEGSPEDAAESMIRALGSAGPDASPAWSV